MTFIEFELNKCENSSTYSVRFKLATVFIEKKKRHNFSSSTH